MEAKTWTLFDKSAWGPGPWLEEPDKAQWTDEATGLPCLAVRNSHLTGTWCGYVGVPPGHPVHGESYGEMEDLEVHYGINFADRCVPKGRRPEEIAKVASFIGCRPLPGVDLTEARICHTPDPGEPDDVWWIGFDCARMWDRSPGMDWRMRQSGGHQLADALDHLRADHPLKTHYRTLEYVKAECARLAHQLTHPEP